MMNEGLDSLNKIGQVIFDKKGFNILAIDVRGISSLTDFVVIAEGNVDRHVSAISQAVVDTMKKNGEPPLYVEGLKDGDWVVIDFGFVMVHLFQPGLREKYLLEQLWKDGEIIDLTINVDSPIRGVL